MSADHAAADNDRRFANILRFGFISEVDIPNALVRVDCGGIVTDWLPWRVDRAGPGSRTWRAPEVGEQVIVGSPSGEPGQGVVLASLYQDSYAAPSNSASVDRVEYSDGAFVEYDRSTHHYTISVPGGAGVTIICQQATVQASSSVTINSPQTTCTGALTVQGPFAYQSGMSGSGGGASSATITGNITIVSGDVKADGIGLKSHHHNEHDGPATSAAVA